MHRENLRLKLEKYRPATEEDAENKSRMLDFLSMHDDCFERSLPIGHFTGSCWLENCDGTKFLLTLHKKIGLWLQLGGHADGDSDLAQVALKEAREESGLKHVELVSEDIFDIGIHLIAEYKGIPAHYHYDVRFLLRTSDPNNDISISDESDDLRWFESLPTNFPNLGCDVPIQFNKWQALKNRTGTKTC